MGTVGELSSSFPKCSKKFCISFVSSLESDRLSFSDLVGDFNVVGLEVLSTAFKKINSGFGFSLKSFRMACSLGTRSFVWFWTISVSLLNFGQFLENAWWSAPQWQHLNMVLVHLSLLCPWMLLLENVVIVSQHVFTVCPHLRRVLQLLDLS